MAVGIDAGGTWNTTAGNKTVVATPAVGDLIVVVHGISNWVSGDSSAITDNNADGLGTYTRFGTAAAPLSTGGGTECALWFSVRNAPIGAASSTTFTATNSGDTGGGLTVLRFSGMSLFGAQAVRQSIGQSTQTESPPSIAFAAATLTGNPIILAVMGEDNPPALTPPAGFTEADDTGWATPTTGIEVCWDDGGNTAASYAWTGGALTDHNEIAIELDTTPAYSPRTAVEFAENIEFTNDVDAPNFTAVAGDTLIAFVYYYLAANSTTAALSDTVGGNDSWTEIGAGLWHTDHGGLRAFYLENASAGSCTVRATFGETIGYPAIAVVPVGGLGAFDQYAYQLQAAPGAGADATTSGNTAALAGAPQMVLGFSFCTGSGRSEPAVGTGFTNIGIGWNYEGVTDHGMRLEHKRVTSTAAVAATFTAATGSLGHLSVALTFFDGDRPLPESIPFGANTFGLDAEAIAPSAYATFFAASAVFAAAIAAFHPVGPAHYAAQPDDPTQPPPVYWHMQHAPVAPVLPLHANFVYVPPQDLPEHLAPFFARAYYAPPVAAPPAKPFATAPQESPELLQPIWSRAPPESQPELHGTEITSGLHAAEIAQADQSAVFWRSAHLVAPVGQTPPVRRMLAAAGQDSPELLQPVFSGTQPPAPITVPLRFAITNALQDQTQPQPVYARAYYAPPVVVDVAGLRPISVPQQESGEQPPPKFSHQAPPTFYAPHKRSSIAAPEPSVEQPPPVYASAVFAPPPALPAPPLRDHIFASGQDDPSQIAPGIFNAYPLPSAEPEEQPGISGNEMVFGLHQAAILQAGQSAIFFQSVGAHAHLQKVDAYSVEAPDPTQIAPAIFNAFPLTVIQAPIALVPTDITFGLHQAAIAQANQSALWWRLAPGLMVPPPALRPTFVSVAQDDPTQIAPAIFNRHPLPSIAPTPPPARDHIFAIEQDDPTQIAPAIFNAYPLPSIAPTPPPPRDHIFAIEQADPSQIAPAIFNAYPLPSVEPPEQPGLSGCEMVFGLHQAAILQAGQSAIFFESVGAHDHVQGVHPYLAEDQFDPTHIAPSYFGAYPLPSIAPTPPPLRKHFFARGADDPTQIAPWFAHQAPPTAPPPEVVLTPTAITFGLHQAAIAQAGQAAYFWRALAAHDFLQGVQAYECPAQFDPTQIAPAYPGNFPLPSIAPTPPPLRKHFFAGEQADPTQIAPAIFNALPLPSVIPPPPPPLHEHLFARPEDDLTQPPPIFAQFPPPSVAGPRPPDPGSFDPTHGGRPPFDQRGRYPDRITIFSDRRVFGLLEALVNLVPTQGVELRIEREAAPVELEDEEAIATVLMMLLADDGQPAEVEADDEETIAMLMIMLLSADDE